MSNLPAISLRVTFEEMMLSALYYDNTLIASALKQYSMEKRVSPFR